MERETTAFKANIEEESKSPEQVIESLPLPQRLRDFAIAALPWGIIRPEHLENLTNLPSVIEEKEVEHQVAAHEMGHVIVAEGEGAIVLKATVVPEGASLGHTIVSFHGFGLFDLLKRRAAVLCGGRVAEEMAGITDHRGTGHDMAVLDYLANFTSVLSQGRISASHFISQAFYRAQRNLANRSQALFSRSFYLHSKGTIV